jgi:hypothetical protein
MANFMTQDFLDFSNAAALLSSEYTLEPEGATKPSAAAKLFCPRVCR